MAHSRKLVLSGVALTMARLPAKQSIAALGQARDELEEEIINSGYLEKAPFKWVGLIIRYGLVDEAKPHYNRIHPKFGDLPLAIEIDVHRLIGATSQEMVSVYKKAALTALIHAGEKYKLPTEGLRLLLDSKG